MTINTEIGINTLSFAFVNKRTLGKQIDRQAYRKLAANNEGLVPIS